MLLGEVEYARPSTLDEAIRLLGTSSNARALAGGQTLINVLKTRAAEPDLLVDLADLEELRGVRLKDGALEIGAMTTYAEMMSSADINRERPVLARVASEIADVQVRNRGTLGGNVCLSDPTNHFPPLMVAMNATLTIAGAGGKRTVPAQEFFLGVYMTAVQPGELLTKVTIGPTGSDGFASVTIGREGTCICSAAATHDGGTRVALGCVDAVPVLIEPGDQDVHEAVRGASFEPPSDVHGSADYRRHLAEVLAERAVEEARG